MLKLTMRASCLTQLLDFLGGGPSTTRAHLNPCEDKTLEIMTALSRSTGKRIFGWEEENKSCSLSTHLNEGGGVLRSQSSTYCTSGGKAHEAVPLQQ